MLHIKPAQSSEDELLMSRNIESFLELLNTGGLVHCKKVA